MSKPIHFIVSRSREGWAVNVESDRLSEHADVGAALAQARQLVAETRAGGDSAAVVDLSQDEQDDL